MKSAKEIFKSHYEKRSGKECDETTMNHMGYVLDAMEEYVNQHGRVSVPDVRNKLTPFANLLKMMEDFNVSIDERVSAIFFEELKQCKSSLEYLSNPPTQIKG